LLNTTSFSLAKLDTETPQLELWKSLDVPVLQVILSGGTVEQWDSQFQGLTPRDTAMNVALPEVDGRIISRAVSFKSVQTRNPLLETDVVVYEFVRDRIEFVADLAASWVQLRQTPPTNRRIALILANYPTRDGRLANGVGLDTPASCIGILKALEEAGYRLSDIPQTGDELIQRLSAGVTNDPEGWELRSVRQQLSLEEYQQYFETLPSEVQKGISDRWSVVSGSTMDNGQRTTDKFPIPGIQLGNVFVGIQPARGYDIDPSLNYHAPDLEPPHAYLAFYYWLRQHFGAQAVVHVGKHGNLEWLPGKSVALSANCYPEVALGAMPHLYPFIVNDPGEGSQAKRRAQAVIIDHLTPPMTRAELYGPLQQLEGLIDEYYEAQSLDPSRLPVIRDRITQLVVQEQLHRDLGIEVEASVEEFLTRADGYLCELKEAQIRDGLHIFGQCPQGRQLRDLIVAIARYPGNGRLGLTRALAEDRGWDFDPLTADPAARLKVGSLKVEGSQEELKVGSLKVEGSEDNLQPANLQPATPLQPANLQPATPLQPANLQIIGDVIEELEEAAAQLVEQLIQDFNHRWTQVNTDKTDIEEGRRQEAEGRKFLSDGDSTPTPREQRIGDGVSDRCSLRSQPEDEGIPSASCPLPSAFSDQDSSTSICVHLRPSAVKKLQIPPIGDATKGELDWICDRLLPALQQTHQEITQLLRGLDGRYVPSGPSGAPTRGRPEVLPTGRNFYSVDIRAIPTETAWDVGRKAAEVLVERYTQENGEYPKTLGLSVWGTSTMRTGGDDLAEALALLGVQPVWDYPSRRVVDFEILPLSVLGRPRVDVTLRISGFFRDAFPNLISLFDQAVVAVAALDEPPAQNPLAWQVKQEQEKWEAAGLGKEEAEVRSRYRIFGSKPGAYGAGLQGLIEAQNWSSEQDLARAYINWSSYAYTSTPPNPPLARGGTGEVAALPLAKGETEGVVVSPLAKGETEGVVVPPLAKGGLGGVAAPEAFELRLKQMQVVLHNQDNREHDLLDSDDYYQFQGGLTAAVRALTGKNPQTYFGDNSIPENPKVRQLREEIARVYRSRVVNPKWIEGVMRHGYKGAFEMAATVDYLFAYDATANCVEDHMYQGVAMAYLFDPKVQEFIQQKNPWALRDMAERLLEANQRGLWKEVKGEMLEGLRAIALQAEAVIEGTNYQ
jgi:cobaltochelatase CobN